MNLLFKPEAIWSSSALKKNMENRVISNHLFGYCILHRFSESLH